MSDRVWTDKKFELPWGATVTIPILRPNPNHTHSFGNWERYVEPGKKKRKVQS